MPTKVKTPSKPKTNSLISALQTNNTVTHNGAVSHTTTDVAVLDLFGKAGAMRTSPETEVIALFRSAYNENKDLALKILFYLADVREGQGERRLFRLCFKWLAENDPTVATKLLKQVPEFTRYDNVLESLENTPLEPTALAFMAKQLRADVKADKPSLAGKWAPSEQASSETTKRLARKLMKTMKMSPKAYRKMLSALRVQINVVERQMCAQAWNEIDYEKVPSRASTIYRKAFGRHDAEGYGKFIKAVEKGEKKINASVLYPYDIVRPLRESNGREDATLNAQWKALPDYLKDNPHNGLVVADVSGSMDSAGYYSGKLQTQSVPPIDIAVSLAIYFAERNIGAFRNYFTIFSSRAQLLQLSGGTIAQNVKAVLGQRPADNTNLQAVFDLILQKAMESNVPETEMPSVLYVVSDMQFDATSCGLSNHEAIKRKYASAGYKMPVIVYWCVNAHSDVPIKFNDKGVCLVSGCSPAIFKTVLTGKSVTPWDIMVSTVMVERYDPIHA